MATQPDMSVDLAGITLRTPLVAAAGTCGYIEELPSVTDVRNFGAITTKSITAKPREGNPPWRLIESEMGLINAIGLANVGVERFMAEKLPGAESVDVIVFGSIAGGSIEEYVQVAAAFDAAQHLPAVEVNVSCPNTSDGLEFGTDAARLREMVKEVRAALTQTKLIVKLSPNVTDVVSLAGAAIDSGADALTLINTISAMAIDVESRRLRLSRGRGGLSGPAVHAVAVRMVHDVYHQVAQKANVPIIGLGGVLRWEDAAELILAGATAVGIGTALFIDPGCAKSIMAGLTKWTQRQGCQSISEMVGVAKLAESPSVVG